MPLAFWSGLHAIVAASPNFNLVPLGVSVTPAVTVGFTVGSAFSFFSPPQPERPRVSARTAAEPVAKRRFPREVMRAFCTCGGSAAEQTLREVPRDAIEADPLLRHRVALTDGDRVVIEGVEVDGH